MISSRAIRVNFRTSPQSVHQFLLPVSREKLLFFALLKHAIFIRCDYNEFSIQMRNNASRSIKLTPSPQCHHTGGSIKFRRRFTEGHTKPPREAIGPLGPIASRGGFVPVFLRRPIAYCDFPVGPDPCPPHLDPPMHHIVLYNMLTIPDSPLCQY